MKHKHHIIPKHMGGSDDPSNLVELTPGEHAEAHRLLYEQYGHWQDYVAWQGLAQLDANFDAAKEAIMAGSRKVDKQTSDSVRARNGKKSLVPKEPPNYTKNTRVRDKQGVKLGLGRFMMLPTQTEPSRE